MKTKQRGWLAVVIVASGLTATSCGGGGEAATTTTPAAVVILTSSNRFEAANVTVKVGQRVEWKWAGGRHNVTSGTMCAPDGKFGSGEVKSEGNFVFTFTTAGEFPYFCTPHCDVGMVGKITVTP